MRPDADVIRVRDEWFARPGGPGSNVGPYATEQEAWDWLRQIRPDGEAPACAPVGAA